LFKSLCARGKGEHRGRGEILREGGFSVVYHIREVVSTRTLIL